MEADIEQIELRRLGELQKQAAMYGPRTEPSILIELQELKHKYRWNDRSDRRQLLNNLDYDFLMNTVAAALMRLNVVEGNQQQDTRRRHYRQLLHDIWMILITVLVLVVLILQLMT